MRRVVDLRQLVGADEICDQYERTIDQEGHGHSGYANLRLVVCAKRCIDGLRQLVFRVVDTEQRDGYDGRLLNFW